VRSEDALIRTVIDRGLSPHDVVNLYYLAVVSLRDREEVAKPRVNPGVLLSRILVRLVEEYQRTLSSQSGMKAA
jgi:hypothetical protein